jgi:hypothetical protein
VISSVRAFIRPKNLIILLSTNTMNNTSKDNCKLLSADSSETTGETQGNENNDVETGNDETPMVGSDERLTKIRTKPLGKCNHLLQKLRKLKEVQNEAPLSEPLESTPLLAGPTIPRSDELLEPEKASDAEKMPPDSRKGWGTLKSHMNEGAFLFGGERIRGDEKILPCESRDSLRQKAFEEFDSGMNFSVKQCVLAILLYMAVSIVIFSYVLEPQWTIIDSCYFAVSTFTTLGT